MRKSIQIKIINKKTDKSIYIEDYEDAKDTFDKLMDLMDAGIVKLVEGTLITNDADDVIRYKMEKKRKKLLKTRTFKDRSKSRCSKKSRTIGCFRLFIWWGVN